MTFQPEPWSDAEADIRKLVHAHWKELAVFQREIKLDIDWQHYRALAERESLPRLQLTTARTTGRDLAGYWISVINLHPHYKGTVFAFQDSYFVLPQYRKANTGLGLMVEMEKNCRLAGAQCIIGSDKEHQSVKPLFDWCKFSSVGTQYQKWIGGD